MGDVNPYCSNCDQLQDRLVRITSERNSLKVTIAGIRRVNPSVDKMLALQNAIDGMNVRLVELQQEKEWLVAIIEEISEMPATVKNEAVMELSNQLIRGAERNKAFTEVIGGIASVVKKLISAHRSERACDRISGDEKKLIDMLSQL